MKITRALKAQVAQLKVLLTEMGRSNCVRDPLGDPGLSLTPPQIHTVMWLGMDGPLKATTLAQRVGCSAPGVTGLIDRLERMGFVCRERHEADRRVVMATLTREGRELFKKLDAFVDLRMTMMMSVMDEKDRDAFISIIERMVHRLRSVEAVVDHKKIR